MWVMKTQIWSFDCDDLFYMKGLSYFILVIMFQTQKKQVSST